MDTEDGSRVFWLIEFRCERVLPIDQVVREWYSIVRLDICVSQYCWSPVK